MSAEDRIYYDERGAYKWRYVGGRRIKIYLGQSLEDAMRESGKFPSGKTSDVEKQRKIDSVNIDFDRDNTLPGLNKEDLDELGKEDKPVLLKKEIIVRNLRVHPEVKQEEYNYLIGQALYSNPSHFPGHKDGYMNMVSRINDGSNSLVLIEMADSQEKYEIVHIMRINDRNLKRMKKS